MGSKPAGASPYGALDMAGNVSEWVGDWYASTITSNRRRSTRRGRIQVHFVYFAAAR